MFHKDFAVKRNYYYVPSILVIAFGRPHFTWCLFQTAVHMHVDLISFHGWPLFRSSRCSLPSHGTNKRRYTPSHFLNFTIYFEHSQYEIWGANIYQRAKQEMATQSAFIFRSHLPHFYIFYSVIYRYKISAFLFTPWSKDAKNFVVVLCVL